MPGLWYYILALRSRYAGVAELADAQDLKSCGIFSRTGSIPVSGTILAVTIYRGVEQFGSSSGS